MWRKPAAQRFPSDPYLRSAKDSTSDLIDFNEQVSSAQVKSITDL